MYVLKKRLLETAAVFAALLLVTFVAWLVNADRFIASAALAGETTDHIGMKFWPAGAHFPWDFLYHWAPVPAFVLAGMALTALVTGFIVPKIACCRRKAVFILLFIALGPGLVINVLLKDQLGRARPREVIEYGGSHQFTQVWQHGKAGKNSSFPSGHAAIAFFMIAPWFVLRDERRKTAFGFLVFGLSFGTLVGIARIVQGGHFFTDVVWSAGLIYITGGILALALGYDGTQVTAGETGQPGELSA